MAQIDALTAQKADSIVGIVLVVIALFISIVNVAIVPVGLRLVEWPTAVALVAGLAATAYLALAFVGGAIQRHQKLTVGQIITTQRVQEILDKKRLPASEIESLRVHARTLLGMDIEDSEEPRVFFERLAARIGLQVPTDFDFSEVESPTVR